MCFRILTKKKIDEICKKIAANQIVLIEDSSINIESMAKITNNNADIVCLVGGEKGVCRVLNDLKRRYENNER